MAARVVETINFVIVFDIQKSSLYDEPNEPNTSMPGYNKRMAKTRIAINKARQVGISAILFQEIHRADLVDFGREHDGDEGHLGDYFCRTFEGCLARFQH